MNAPDLLSAILSESWRADPPPAALTAAELESIAPALHHSGAAGLAWWRLRESALAAHPAGIELHEAYRLQVLRNTVREGEIREIFDLLHADGIDALLVKGWAVARTYSDPGLRPVGDIDLIVRPSHLTRARHLLHGRELVDFDHADFAHLDERLADGLFARSETCGSIRVLGPHDHLALLCAHFLRHGAWRPLWLCDIAAAAEAHPSAIESRPVECCAGLAHRLLGARIDRPIPLPRWLVPAVHRQWKRAFYAAHAVPPAIADSLWRLPKSLRRRWPDPITATAITGASYNNVPRVIFQLAYYGFLAARYIRRL